MAIRHFPSAKISASTTHSVRTETTSGSPTSTIADGAIAVDTTNDVFYYRSSGAWTQVAASATTVSDTPPGSPSSGDLWYESDTGNLLVRYDDGAGDPQWVEVGHAADSTVVEYAANIDGGIPSSNYTGMFTFDGGGV